MVVQDVLNDDSMWGEIMQDTYFRFRVKIYGILPIDSIANTRRAIENKLKEQL